MSSYPWGTDWRVLVAADGALQSVSRLVNEQPVVTHTVVGVEILTQVLDETTGAVVAQSRTSLETQQLLESTSNGVTETYRAGSRVSVVNADGSGSRCWGDGWWGTFDAGGHVMLPPDQDAELCPGGIIKLTGMDGDTRLYYPNQQVVVQRPDGSDRAVGCGRDPLQGDVGRILLLRLEWPGDPGARPRHRLGLRPELSRRFTV